MSGRWSCAHPLTCIYSCIYTWPVEITIDEYKLATDNAYRTDLIGTPATYVTGSGTTVIGNITEHPTSGGGLMLAVTQPDGKWAAIYAGESFETNA